MQAVLYDPDFPTGLRLGDAPEPEPLADQVVVEVQAFSINFADIAFLSKRFTPGDVVGFEAAGVVVAEAGDGTGPPLGSRVTGFSPAGGWAERRAVAVDSIALVPGDVEFGVAAAVPVAGVTALRVVRALGDVVGRRVLVTGASGGVGRMAVQLAARAGAYVVACVGSAQRGDGLERLGAAEVVVALDDVEPVHGVIDLVGGPLLTQAYTLVSAGGSLQSVGAASLEPSCIDFEQARLRMAGRIEAFNVFSVGPYGIDIPPLLEWVRRGDLDAGIGWRGTWDRVAEAAEALRERRVAGKAVLDLAADDGKEDPAGTPAGE